MAARALPPQSLLNQLLRYERETGKLFWLERGPEWFDGGVYGAERKARCWNERNALREAFTATNAAGYKKGIVLGFSLLAHRVIWKMVTGQDPDQVDHLDGVRSNNRWANLRDVDQSQNQRNACIRADNKSGASGVMMRRGKWFVQIWGEKGRVRTRSFESFDAAVTARDKLASKYGYSKRHGT